MTTLIYCADSNRKYAEIALRHGFKYGAQLPNFVYFSPYFVDNNYHNPDRIGYMKSLIEHRPAIATVLDLQREDQFDEVMSWAYEAASYVSEALILIPKISFAIQRFPREIGGKQVRLGYSVPSSHGGTELFLWDFDGWPVHLLGGSPQKQIELMGYLNVKSADGNYANGRVSNGQYFANGYAVGTSNRWWPQFQETGNSDITDEIPYRAFELSCINFQGAAHKTPAYIRYAHEGDIAAIKKIANQYRNELGYVMLPALRESATKHEMYVACNQDTILGFIRWHKRRDGWHTIYEIGVHRDFQGKGIGRLLLSAVPQPTRLKVTTDNRKALDFYTHRGFQITKSQSGRKRPLHVMELTNGR